jgi:hypothetical protein
VRASVLKFVVTPVIVDLDDDGEVIGQLPPEQTPAWEFIGRHGLERHLKPKLAELDAFLADRTTWLREQPKPNREQRRRARPKRGRG